MLAVQSKSHLTLTQINFTSAHDLIHWTCPLSHRVAAQTWTIYVEVF